MRERWGGMVGWSVGVVWWVWRPNGLPLPDNTSEYTKYIQNASRIVSRGQATELSLRKTRTELAILIHCARMAEETLDDDKVFYIRFTPQLVQHCISYLRKWADEFAQWLDQWEESDEAVQD